MTLGRIPYSEIGPELLMLQESKYAAAPCVCGQARNHEHAAFEISGNGDVGLVVPGVVTIDGEIIRYHELAGGEDKRAGQSDLELNRIRPRCRIGVGYGFAKRSCAGVVQVGDGEGRHG